MGTHLYIFPQLVLKILTAGSKTCVDEHYSSSSTGLLLLQCEIWKFFTKGSIKLNSKKLAIHCLVASNGFCLKGFYGPKSFIHSSFWCTYIHSTRISPLRRRRRTKLLIRVSRCNSSKCNCTEKLQRVSEAGEMPSGLLTFNKLPYKIAIQVSKILDTSLGMKNDENSTLQQRNCQRLDSMFGINSARGL